MRCALVFYFVATIFMVGYSLPELCVFDYYFGERRAKCGRDDVIYTFDFIPPVYQNISFIDLEGQPLTQLPYNGFRKLNSQSSISVIWLRLCQLSRVDAGALLNLHKLIYIDFSHNDIKQIDSKLFSDTKKIINIDMQYNKIEVLPSGLFENLTLLKTINLHHNRIREVEWNSFKNTPLLWIIDLTYNKIEFMNVSFKDKFDNLKYLLLRRNPWKCDCELVPLYELLIKIDKSEQYEPVCEKPPTLHRRYWSNIGRDEFVCSPEDAISTQDSVMTSTEPTISTELLVTNGSFLKLDNDRGMNNDAEPVNNIVEVTSSTFEKPKTESSEKPVTKGKPETRTEISDITQRPLIIEEKQVVLVEEETNSSEISELVTAESDTEAQELLKTSQEPIDDQSVSIMTSTGQMISTELLVTNGTILKLDNDRGMNKDAEPVNIVEVTSSTFEKPKNESSKKPDTKGKLEIRTEISDITQRPLTIDEKQVVTVEEETNSSEISELVTAKTGTGAEESIKTPQEPVGDQSVITTTEISFNNLEGADTNVQQVSNDLKWLPWTLFSVAIVCLLGCVARYTFTRYRRRFMPSVRRTEQLTEETIELMYFDTTQQANC